MGGLVPVMMIFLEKEHIQDVEKCESYLCQTVLNALDNLEINEEEEEGVILNFVLPKKVGVYDRFASHPKVLRVLVSDENHSFDESCKILSQSEGVVGHIGTGILEKLNLGQTYSEFTDALGRACARFHNPSVEDDSWSVPPSVANSPRTPKSPEKT